MSLLYFEESIDEKKVEEIVSRHGNDPGNLIAVLQDTQDEFGYIPKDCVDIIAGGLNIYPSRVFGIITFYAQFALMPKGENIIKVCEGTACHVKGCDAISELVGKKIGINGPGTTVDKKFTVEHVACVGACAKAPVLLVNKDVYGKVEPAMVDSIIEKYI